MEWEHWGNCHPIIPDYGLFKRCYPASRWFLRQILKYLSNLNLILTLTFRSSLLSRTILQRGGLTKLYLSNDCQIFFKYLLFYDSVLIIDKCPATVRTHIEKHFCFTFNLLILWLSVFLIFSIISELIV